MGITVTAPLDADVDTEPPTSPLGDGHITIGGKERRRSLMDNDTKQATTDEDDDLNT